VEEFLKSNDLDPAAINGDIQATGGVRLACAILELSNSTAAVFPSDGDVYVYRVVRRMRKYTGTRT
jgi:hypothetical protein